MRADRIKHKKKPHPFRWEMRVHHGGQVQTKLKVSNSGKMLKHYFKISNTFFFFPYLAYLILMITRQICGLQFIL